MFRSGMSFVTPDSMFPTHEDFHGISPLLMRRSMSFSGVEEVRVDDDMSDDGSQLGEKKRRLKLEQVKALEKSFESGNKLEPERKMQLARALDLQPRQVAIWFQNRRARWKTKQLEKDYDILKRQFEVLKADNDTLKSRNKKLHAELLALKNRESIGTGPIINLNKETEASWSNGSEKGCDMNMGTTRTPSADSPLYSLPSNKNIFPSSLGGATNLTQLLQNSSSIPDPQCPKIDQTVPDEGFCNMFNAIDNQPSFWPWTEHQHFH